MGFRVDNKGIKPLTRKLQAIAAFPTPQKPKHLLDFLGALNYYRRALPKLGGKSAAEILQPLYEIATQRKPGKKFTYFWLEKGLESDYGKGKDLLMNACQLTFPDPNTPLAITTDASNHAMHSMI